MEKKLHNFDLEFHQKRLAKHSISKYISFRRGLFTKYFPKYLEKLSLKINNGSIESKIKRAKIIRSFQPKLLALDRQPNWRGLLATKIKSVKALTPYTEKESPKPLAKKIKSFSGLKSLQIPISMPERSQFPFWPYDKQGELSRLRVLKNIGYLRNLEHLELNPVSQVSIRHLRKLNSHKRLLGSLKTLKIFVDWKDASEDEILELPKNENLLKKVTSLKLSTLHTPSHFESFQRLGELCPSINNLNFGFQAMQNGVPINYLQTLKAFQHLKTFHLCIADMWTFLKDFVLPPSIQFLKLSFSECVSKEMMRKSDKDFCEEELSKAFEENHTLVKFYENFKGLNHLETFEFHFSIGSSPEAFEYQNYLLRSLLKRISSPLKNLVILPNLLSGTYGRLIPRTDHFLPQFFESCENFASTLEVLKIGSSLLCCSKFDLSASWNKFPKLSCIRFKASFSQAEELGVIGSFLQNFIYLGSSIMQIKVKFVIMRDVKSMLSLLNQMNQLEKRDELKIYLRINLANCREIDESGISFADGINELQKCDARVKGVSFRPHYLVFSDEEFSKFLKEFRQRFDTSFALYDHMKETRWTL